VSANNSHLLAIGIIYRSIGIIAGRLANCW